MKETKVTESPMWLINRKSAFLAALHVLMLVISLAILPPIELGADRTLP